MNVVAIIQARMGSTRLPGKVLMDLAGEPMLARVVARTGRTPSVTQTVIAMTDKPGDDILAEACDENQWAYFRGKEEDVLDRYYQAAQCFDADIIVRITSDCPLIDPGVVDGLIHAFLARAPGIDYVSNIYPERRYPRGLDTEVLSREALEQAWTHADTPAQREHVTPYVHQHPDRFRIHNDVCERDMSDLRWTVDTPEDMAFAQRIYAHFQSDTFSWQDVIDVLEQHPDWKQINEHVQQKRIT